MSRRAIPGDKITSTIRYDEWNSMQEVMENSRDVIEGINDRYELGARPLPNAAATNYLYVFNDTSEDINPGMVVYWRGPVGIQRADAHELFPGALKDIESDSLSYDDREDQPPAGGVDVSAKDDWPLTSPILKLCTRAEIDLENWQMTYPHWGVSVDTIESQECGWVQVAGIARCWATYGYLLSSEYDGTAEMFAQYCQHRVGPPWNPNVFTDGGIDADIVVTGPSDNNTWKYGECLTSHPCGAKVVWRDPAATTQGWPVRVMVNLSDRGGQWHWQGMSQESHSEGEYKTYAINGPFYESVNYKIKNVYFPERIGGPSPDPIGAGDIVTVTYNPDIDQHIITGAECSS